MFDTVASAIDDLSQGKIIIVCDDERRENEGDLIALADRVTPQVVNFMITHGRGLLCMPISEVYAQKLHLPIMVSNNTDIYNTNFTVSIDHISNSTGISAYDRATTIRMVLDNNAKAEDFRRPGHIFPLLAKPRGLFDRLGHTEAVIDLAKLCESSEAGLLCEVMNDDGTMARRDDLFKLAKIHNLKVITVKDIFEYRKYHGRLISRIANALLPTRLGQFNIIGYSNIVDNYEHIAIVKGDVSSSRSPLVRIHSECLTGDVFHSLRCDCGEQLDIALKKIEAEGCGAVVYLRQEGRGIGLLNKIRAYELQQQGLDTMEANIKLGFNGDLREYFLASQILRDLNIKQVRLMTNNPEKVSALEKYGVKVDKRVEVKVPPQPENEHYIRTKADKFGHLL